MRKYKIWNKQDDLYLPSGACFTAEQVFDQYAWTRIPTMKVLLEDMGGITGAILNLEQYKQHHGIDSTLSDEEAIARIEEIENAPVESSPANAQMTQADAQMLGQIMTDLQLSIMEA